MATRATRAVAVSVVLCTHDPRAGVLEQCLAGLREQRLPANDWELIVVDNASTPPLALGDALAWHPNAKLLHEPTLGLTPARLRGIRDAAADLLVLVDDDNVLDADYLDVALRVAAERSHLGAWSGQCRPVFEETPPEWTRRYWGNLVIREFDDDRWSNLPRLADTMPCGAGLCVRRTAALEYVRLHNDGHRRFQLDRAGESLLSGGDNDLAACACRLGYGVGLVAALRLRHLIPPQRLTAQYLARLAEGIHFSAVLLDAAWGMPHPPRGMLGRLADRARVLRCPPPHRAILRAAFRGRDRAVRHLASVDRASS